MFKFFYEYEETDKLKIYDKEMITHITKSLRSRIGDEIILCNKNEDSAIFRIININKNELILSFCSKIMVNPEPDINLHVYVAYPKSNKFELCIQKLCELGVNEITPIVSKNCVVKPSEKDFLKKLERFEKISKSASMQSRRNKILKINKLISFKECLKEVLQFDEKFILYENSNNKIEDSYFTKGKNIAIITGSEGGFDKEEIKIANYRNIIDISLGKRILRCETAPIVISSIVMYKTNNF